MRRITWIVFIMVSALASCVKSKEKAMNCEVDTCLNKAPDSETTKVEEYLATKGITGTVKHCSGLYYKILEPGAGANPSVCSYITIHYKGELEDGTVFDQTTVTPFSSYLGNLISGWVNGLPLLKKGGKMQLFIPPFLGYGAQASPKIPANSMLIFEIELLNVQ